MNTNRAAEVRVFLCTYRRNQLLRRSLDSLLTQTFTNWLCELHNDAPDDPFPTQLAAEINDKRISVINHTHNLGGVATFNLMFEPRPEAYITLLEDDNWWEPEFLRTMVAVMDAHPHVRLSWANMRYWREEADGTWTDENRTVWDRPTNAGVEIMAWPNSLQADAALHSTGAMLIRSGDLEDFKIPLETLFEFADPVRERAIPHPLLFVPQPLVNFALTRETSRAKSSAGRLEHYVLLLASFFKHVRPDEQMILKIWEKKRRSSVRSTHNLIIAGLSDSNCRQLLRYVKPFEWILFLLIGLRHFADFTRAFGARSRYPELYSYLDRQTACRVSQNNLRSSASHLAIYQMMLR